MRPPCQLRQQHAIQPWANNRHGRRRRWGALPPAASASESLEATIRRKHNEVGQMLLELGEEGAQERLQSAFDAPMRHPYKLGARMQEAAITGSGVLIAEISRPPNGTPQHVAALAQRCIAAGADAVAVKTDLPDGLRDLWVVAQSVPQHVPVLRRDWILHPIQVVEAKEAGASGVLGCVAQILSTGTPLLSGYAAAVGMDAPIEVVNLMEVEALAAAGVPMFGINIGVGLSLSVPGAADSIARGLIDKLPMGSASVVGCTTIAQAREARLAGADALLIKEECLVDPERTLPELRYLVSGDD